MAFPPNYRQERNNRDRAKQQKALEKQAKRDEKRRSGSTDDDANTQQPQPAEQKDQG